MAEERHLSDEEARTEAQKRLREKAEAKLKEIESKISTGEWYKIKEPERERELKELRRLFEASRAGAARFFEISDILMDWADGVEKRCIPVIPAIPYQPYVQALQKASEVFLELAAN